MRYLIVSVFFLCISYPSNSQIWQKTIGGLRYEVGESVISTSDGNYLFAGISTSFTSALSQKSRIYLVKTNRLGDPIFSKVILFDSDSTSTPDHRFVLLNNIIETDDMGIVVSGHLSTGKAYLMKLDANYNVEWTKVYSEPNYFMVTNDIIATSDNGFLLAGTSYPPNGNHGQDAFLLKTNASGAVEWKKRYKHTGNTLQESAFSVMEVPGEGYAVSGTSNKKVTPQNDRNWNLLLMRTDFLGNTTHSKIYDVSGTKNYGEKVFINDDGSFLVFGSQGNASSIAVLKTDHDLTFQSNKILINNTQGYNPFEDMVKTDDGGFAVVGIHGNPSDSHGFVLKTDSTGSPLWQHVFGDTTITFPDNRANGIIQTDEGNYVVIGSTNAFNAQNEDMYMLQLGSDGDIGCNSNPTTFWDYNTSMNTANGPSEVNATYIVSSEQMHAASTNSLKDDICLICNNQSILVDTIPPTVVCPENIYACSPIVAIPPIIASDNCILDYTESTWTSGSFFPVGTTPVSYTAYDLSGNVNSCTFNVHRQPIPQANAGQDKSICLNESVRIGENISTIGDPLYTYSWTPVVGLSNASSNYPKASPTTTTTYSLIVSDSVGCTSNADQVTINVSQYPDCCQPPINFDVTHSSSSSVTISWDPSPGATQYQLQIRIPPSAGVGNFMATYITSNTSKNITNLIPNTPYQYRIKANCANNTGDPMDLSSYNFGFLTTDNHTSTKMMSDYINEPWEETVYENSMIDVHIYPNPSNGSVRISSYSNESDFDVLFYNAMGALVRTMKADASSAIEVKNLDQGFYIVKIVGDQGETNKRLVVN